MSKDEDWGWRFCRNELPEETGRYWARTACGVEDGFLFNKIEGKFERDAFLLNVVQWCKLMPPLTEDDK